MRRCGRSDLAHPGCPASRCPRHLVPGVRWDWCNVRGSFAANCRTGHWFAKTRQRRPIGPSRWLCLHCSTEPQKLHRGSAREAPHRLLVRIVGWPHDRLAWSDFVQNPLHPFGASSNYALTRVQSTFAGSFQRATEENRLIQGLTSFRGESGMTHNRIRRFDRVEDRSMTCRPVPTCPVCGNEVTWGRGDVNPFLGVIG